MISDSEKLNLLVKLDSQVNKIQDLDFLLEEILRGCRIMTNADAGSIYVLDDGKLHIRYAQNDSLQQKLQPGEKLLYSIFSIEVSNKTLSGSCALSGEMINIPDAYKIPEGSPYSFDSNYDRLTNYRTQSILTIPLKINTGEILGVIQIINAKDKRGKIRAFNEDDELLVAHFASNAAIAMQRAKLTRTIILRMIKMAELRDPKETGPHVNRVAGYAAEIFERWARKKNYSDRDIQKSLDTFRMAAMLHDVGKVGISDVILKKPGRFTPDEFEVMKQHTVVGARLFADKQSEFDEMARLVALTHHENWDGTGYPGKIDLATGEPLESDVSGKPVGLRGEEIPIWGRIVSLADVYDALRCRRVYKEAWEENEVLQEMEKLRGTKFDPEFLDIFFEVLPNLQQVSQRYPD